jgi:hypothetical protein
VIESYVSSQRHALPGNGKYGGSKKKAPDVLLHIMHIAECLAEVSPAYIVAWNGQMRCTASGDCRDQTKGCCDIE